MGFGEGMMAADAARDEPVAVTVRDQVLTEASALVHGDRQAEYGSPEHNFGQSASLIDAYFKPKLAEGQSVTPADIAAFMVLMKVARLSTDITKLDSWVDIAGYAACGAEVRSLG